jgi:hypothetical protein
VAAARAKAASLTNNGLVMPAGLSAPVPAYDPARADAELARRAALVETAIVFQAGRKAEAAAAIAAQSPLPGDAASAQLIGLVVDQPAPEAAGRRVDALRLFTVLPRYEGPGISGFASDGAALSRLMIGSSTKKPQRNAYSGSVPFFKANGFKDRAMKDGRGTTISFTGDASSATAVEEMTLLRAADLALAAGKPGFVVLDKRDFSMSAQITMNGSAIGSPQPAGFKSELDVALVDASGPDDRFIAAADVVAALAPVYKRP